MTLSAIVVSFRTGPVLWDCLAALLRMEEVGEIVLVDNGNPIEVEFALSDLAARETKLRVIRGQGNVGFGAACNIAAESARGDVVLIVNPDAVLELGAGTSLAAALGQVQATCVVGGDLRDEHGLPDRGSRRDRLTMWRAIVSFTGLSRFSGLSPVFRDLHHHKDPLPDVAIEVGAVSGALMAMRRVDFLAMGGFDEGYFLHVEDFDLCRRVELAGGAVLFQPGPHGVHHRSSSQVDNRSLARHKARSFERYFLKFARSRLQRASAVLVGGALRLVLPLAAKRQ